MQKDAAGDYYAHYLVCAEGFLSATGVATKLPGAGELKLWEQVRFAAVLWSQIR